MEFAFNISMVEAIFILAGAGVLVRLIVWYANTSTDRKTFKEFIAGIGENFDNIEKKFDNIGEKFDDVGKKFDDVGKKFDNVGEKFDSIGGKFEGMGEKFDSIGRKFEKIEQKMDQKIVRIEGKMDRRLVAMEQKFVTIEQKMDQRFVTIEQKMDQRFVAMDQRFVAMDQRFVAMDQKFIAIEEKMDQKFVAIEEKMDGRLVTIEQKMERKFAATEQNFAEIGQEIAYAFNRLPNRVAGSTSPMSLNELGCRISREVDAAGWAARNLNDARQATPGMSPYRVQRYCFSHAGPKNLSDEEMRKIEDAAYTHGVTVSEVLEVLAIELRDLLLAQGQVDGPS